MVSILISAKEWDCISRIFSPDSFPIKALSMGGNQLSEESVSFIRDALTDKYDFLGLDENYEATPDGLILEQLIDKFYV